MDLSAEHNSAPRELSFSVPQGSCARPVLYLAYASTLEKEVSQNIGIHGYADDHALRKTFSANSRVEENMAIKDMEDSSINIKSWMDANRLKMNGSKTEFIMFGHHKQLQKFITSSFNIDGDSVNRLHIVKYLGALLDEELTLKQHTSIQYKCKSAMYGIHRIKSVRSSLTAEAAEILALGTVISHSDCANAIFIGLPQCSLKSYKEYKIWQPEWYWELN